MKKLLLLIIATLNLLLAGCQTDPQIVLSNGSLAQGLQGEPPTTHRIFVATNRNKLSDEINFGTERAAGVSYARYGISVPPSHKPGQVEWPKGNPSLAKNFGTVEVQHFSGQAQFIDAVNTQLETVPAANREAVVFIHGFNTNFVEGLYRFTQMVHDFGLKGIPLHYSWPSKGKARAYVYDRDSVNIARDTVVDALGQLARTDVDGITLLGHSMGGLLTVEVLRQIALTEDKVFRRKLKGVILISPDIDAEVFRSQLSSMKPLPKPFVIFVSPQDKALRLSARLTGKQSRVGSLTSTDQIADLDVTLIDVSNFKGGDSLNHMTAATSPALINLITQLRKGDQVASLLRDETQSAEIGANIVKAGGASRIVLAPFSE